MQLQNCLLVKEIKLEKKVKEIEKKSQGKEAKRVLVVCKTKNAKDKKVKDAKKRRNNEEANKRKSKVWKVILPKKRICNHKQRKSLYFNKKG
jgi:V8-like Glu-specific endopeptidase